MPEGSVINVTRITQVGHGWADCLLRLTEFRTGSGNEVVMKFDTLIAITGKSTKCSQRVFIKSLVHLPAHMLVATFMEGGGGRGAVAQSVEILVRRFRVRFPLWPPAPYWLGRCLYNVTG